MVDNVLRKIKLMKPARVLVLGFALLILTGTLILMSPLATASGKGTDIITALFTSTSAVCVTGLVVVDSTTYWTNFGKTVILILIQIGALGFMTLATLFFLIVGKKISLSNRLLIQSSLSVDTVGGVVKFVKNVLIYCLIIESAGALLLSFAFIPKFGFLRGIAYSIFHAVSAFCNAGFDILPGDSLCQFVSNPIVNITICLLIIIGGLGFAVAMEVLHKRKFKELSLHSKIVILMTSLLLIFGTICFFILEYNNINTIYNLSLPSKIQASFFAAVTPRTAGFNTIPVGSMREGSKLFTIFLMFIGASPGSTGGGVKTSCVGVLFIVAWCILGNKNETEIFQRRIPSNVIKKATTVCFMAIMWIMFVTMIISSIEQFPLLDEIFEVFSAFGTVGLSTGITGQLSGISKILLIVTMFFGRVGILTVIFAISQRGKSDRTKMYKYPDGNIIVS